MAINKDFEKLLHHLNTARIRYLIVGAYAVIYHTEPRYTKDLDIWIEPEQGNARKVYEALKAFGAPLQDLTIQDLCTATTIYQIGVEPNRVDILTGIEGLRFSKAWSRRKIGTYGQEKAPFLAIEDAMQAKKKAGRPMDLIDLSALKLAKKLRRRRVLKQKGS